jgi:quinoprotein glucose dehydrogenase
VLVLLCPPAPLAISQTDLPTYGHDGGGDRYSPLRQITPENVNSLAVAWVYHMKPANAPDFMPNERFPGGPGVPGGAPPSSATDNNASAQASAEGTRPARRPSRFLPSEVTPIVAGGLMYISRRASSSKMPLLSEALAVFPRKRGEKIVVLTAICTSA